MSILKWLLVIIGCVFALTLIYFLIWIVVYCLYKIMSGIYEVFYDKQKSEVKNMIAAEVLANLSQYSLWDYKDYKINKEEAEVIVKVLKDYVKEHPEERSE